MLLSWIELFQFRNYTSRRFQFDRGINLLIGTNGLGKSNLIEAIQLLSISKSLKASTIEECIQFGQSQAVVRAEIQKDRAHEISIDMRPHGKTIRVDQKTIQRSSDLMQYFHTVLFSPEDLEIIKGTPQERKRYLDIFLSKTDPVYLENLNQYKRILKQKRRVLHMEKPDMELLRISQMQQRKANQQLLERRLSYLEYMQKRINHYLEGSFSSYGTIEIQYQNTMEQLEDNEILLREIRQRDASYGVHRDDAVFCLQERQVKKYMSHGETRLVAFLMRLAEKDYLVDVLNIAPVLLLDDAFLGLDRVRTTAIRHLMDNELQKIITLTEKAADFGAQPIKEHHLP